MNSNEDNKGKLFILSLVFLYLTANHFIVHPYLLADNRHYIFYIFKMISKMRWLFCPVYAVGLISIFFQMPKVKIFRVILQLLGYRTTLYFYFKLFSLEYFNAFGLHVLHGGNLGSPKTF